MIPAQAKAGKGGKGNAVPHAAILPAGRRAQEPREPLPGQTQVGAGAPGSAPSSLVECPSHQATSDEGPDRCSRTAPTTLPSSLRCWGGRQAASNGSFAGTGNPVPTPGRESHLPRGKMEKWECREPEQTGWGRKEGWGQEPAGGKINRFRQNERETSPVQERKKGEKRFSGRPSH